jgi:mRNA interferase MazF
LIVPSAGQGDVWNCQLSPVEGHEQAGQRPCLVVSVDSLGQGPSELAIVVPITRTNRTALEVEMSPPEGGLTDVSYAQPYQVRTVSRERLVTLRGRARSDTVREVIRRVHLLTKAP